jgi:hypothetical protein
VLLAPHQGPSLGGSQSTTIKGFSAPAKSVRCLCQWTGTNPPDPDRDLPGMFATAQKSPAPVICWLDPSGVPTKCLLGILAIWGREEFGAPSLSLGIRSFGGTAAPSQSEDFEFLRPSSTGVIPADSKDLENSVWYPSLARDPEILSRIANMLNPIEIFPLADHPIASAPDLQLAWTRHHQLLDGLRVRTERFIYLSERWPRLAFETLRSSLGAFGMVTNIPRTPVVTLGPGRQTFLASIAAAALTGSVVSAGVDEVVFDGLSQPVGSFVLRMRK